MLVDSMHARLESGRFTLIPDPLTWVRFDLAGRWSAALMDAVTYRRSFGGKVLAITGERVGEERLHHVAPVEPDEAEELSRRIHAWAVSACAGNVARDALVQRAPAGVTPEDVLRRAAELDVDALAASARRFHAIYRGNPIVPPDRTEDVLVQSTMGCAHNRCSFCVFYRNEPYSMRSRESLEQHVDEVADFLGPALCARRGIFVGDASALTANFSTLCSHLSVMRERLTARMLGDRTACLSVPHVSNVEPLAGFRMFCDAFLHPLRTEEELAHLRDLGLYRVYIGLESGCDELLAFLHKPATARTIRLLVERMKRVGLAVSLIVMTGVGGRQFSERHAVQTSALLNALPLERRDNIVFSEFFVLPGAQYAADAQEAGLVPMGRVECREQMREMRGLLTFPPDQAPHRQMYDARQLLY